MDLLISGFSKVKNPLDEYSSLVDFPHRKIHDCTFSLGKTILSFFNLVHFFLIPFSVLIVEGYDPVSVILGLPPVFITVHNFSYI
jgi:hypothetical protein